MLLVAGSGVIGRYMYTRLHANLNGHEDTLEQLKAAGERMRKQSTSIAVLPGLVEEFDRIEQRLIVPPKSAFGRVLHLFTGAIRIARARFLLREKIQLAVNKARSGDSPLLARHAEHIGELARRYGYRRLEAGRRMNEYQLYARLFSFWHVLHVPLFFMLLIAGIVHVVAINVY
jgi:hypothetical protein